VQPSCRRYFRIESRPSEPSYLAHSFHRSFRCGPVGATIRTCDSGNLNPDGRPESVDQSIRSMPGNSMLKVPIFYYHSIGNHGPETLALGDFRRHLELVREHHFKPVTFAELLALNPDDCGRYVVLSFDDGLLDNFENAAPLLNEFGYRATFFVIPGFDNVIRWVNPKTRAWSESRKEGFSLPFPSMQKHHRRQLLDCGMEIGCHTMNHPKLNEIDGQLLQIEIADSKALLEDQLGSPVTTLCYPKGRYNRIVLDRVRSAGYTGACTTVPAYYDHHTPKYECGRFLIENPSLFNKILAWSSTVNWWTGPLCGLLRVPLKLKNTYF
jgi:peptidoglycan/xylan/chitin deacetylase (PgdA/CDA1 family)